MQFEHDGEVYQFWFYRLGYTNIHIHFGTEDTWRFPKEIPPGLRLICTDPHGPRAKVLASGKTIGIRIEHDYDMYMGNRKICTLKAPPKTHTVQI